MPRTRKRLVMIWSRVTTARRPFPTVIEDPSTQSTQSQLQTARRDPLHLDDVTLVESGFRVFSDPSAHQSGGLTLSGMVNYHAAPFQRTVSGPKLGEAQLEFRHPCK